MPYVPHIRASFSGFLGTSAVRNEIWSCTLNFGGTIGAPFVVQADANDIGALWATFWSSATSKIGSNAKWDQLKLANVDATNHVVGAVKYFTPAAPVAGGQGMASGIPYQVSNALSLRTGQRGAGNRGRIFLPQPTFDTGVNTGTIADDTALDGLLTVFRTFANAASTRLAVPLIVASSRNGNVPVTVVEAGRVLDTVRKRRNKLKEDYRILPL